MASYKYSGIKIPNLPLKRFLTTPFYWLIPIGVSICCVYLIKSGYLSLGVAAVCLVAFFVLSVKFFITTISIMVSSNCLIFGSSVVVYENIKSITVDEDKKLFSLKRKNGKRIIISAEKFTTNARKEWKIEANKQDKFYKVISKILDSALSENPDILINVIAADRFKKYHRPGVQSK